MAKRCKACGKCRYRNYGHAISALLYANKRTGTPLRIYPCPTGRGFHLTKQPKRDPP